MTNTIELCPTIHLDALYHLYHGTSPSRMMENLSIEQALALEHFVWEKTLEFGIRSKGKNFSQAELLGQLRTAALQHSDTTFDSLFKGWQNTVFQIDEPAIIKARIKERIDIMAHVAMTFIY